MDQPINRFFQHIHQTISKQVEKHPALESNAEFAQHAMHTYFNPADHLLELMRDIGDYRVGEDGQLLTRPTWRRRRTGEAQLYWPEPARPLRPGMHALRLRAYRVYLNAEPRLRVYIRGCIEIYQEYRLWFAFSMSWLPEFDEPFHSAYMIKGLEVGGLQELIELAAGERPIPPAHPLYRYNRLVQRLTHRLVQLCLTLRLHGQHVEDGEFKEPSDDSDRWWQYAPLFSPNLSLTELVQGQGTNHSARDALWDFEELTEARIPRVLEAPYGRPIPSDPEEPPPLSPRSPPPLLPPPEEEDWPMADPSPPSRSTRRALFPTLARYLSVLRYQNPKRK